MENYGRPRIKDLREENQQQSMKINILTNVVIKQEEKISALENRVTAAYRCEIRPNLIIYGLLEKVDETRETLLKEVYAFFKEKLGISAKIMCDNVRRLGDSRS